MDFLEKTSKKNTTKPKATQAAPVVKKEEEPRNPELELLAQLLEKEPQDDSKFFISFRVNKSQERRAMAIASIQVRPRTIPIINLYSKLLLDKQNREGSHFPIVKIIYDLSRFGYKTEEHKMHISSSEELHFLTCVKVAESSIPYPEATTTKL